MRMPSCGSTRRTIIRTTDRGRVELAALLAGRVGELADQVLVRGAEQVGELEVLVAQPVLGEVDDQLAQLLVRDRRLADLAVEVDVLDARRRGAVLLSSSAARALFSPSPTLWWSSSRR